MKRKINDPDMKSSARTAERYKLLSSVHEAQLEPMAVNQVVVVVAIKQIFDFNSNSIKMKIKNYSTLLIGTSNCICTRYPKEPVFKKTRIRNYRS
jgi:hypothetical protein